MKRYLMFVFGILLISFVSAVGMPNPFGDYDGDGVLNKDDNCYYVYNPFQVDSDGDDWGNCCDADYIMNKDPNVYCDDLNQNFCGDSIKNPGEECDDGVDNKVLCDNSTSSCSYCSSTCELIILNFNSPQEEENNNICRSGKTKLNFYCEPIWKCSGWTSCNLGVESRQCWDINNCEYVYNKPSEVVGCEEEISEKVLIENRFNYFFLVFSLVCIFLIILLVVLLGLGKR